MRYRIKSGYHGRWENGRSVTYGPGDPIDLTAEQAAQFGDKVAPIGDQVKTKEAPPAAASVAPAPAAQPEPEPEPPPAKETAEEPPEVEPEPDPETEPTTDFGLADLPVLEAVAKVKSISHPDTLRALLEEERAGRDRKTVAKAIKARLP